MKVAIITDTHYGCRKGSKHLHDYFELFYKNIFFPALKEHGVEAVVHMGDAFDSRKSIDYQSLEWAKRVVFDPLSEYETHMIIGNHDCYYKNTNNVNSPELLLQTYPNITTYSKVSEATLDNLKVLFIPWINAENYEDTVNAIKVSDSVCAMGHLELSGYPAHRGHYMDKGLSGELFKTFTKVFSGHYHTRSDDGRIFYLGNPYEMYWNDANDTRGFHIFDTETLETKPIDNPFRMFYTIFYEDTNHQTFDTREYEDKLIKLVVRKKSDTKKFEKFVDKLYSANVADMKIVENFDFSGWYESVGDEVETEDTLSILNRYIKESEVDLDKNRIEILIGEVYQEACELV